MEKVLFYCHTFYPQNSGYANAFKSLIESILMYKRNIAITVCTPYPLGDAEELKYDRLKVIRLKPFINIKKLRYYLNSIYYAKAISNIDKKDNYNLIFVETLEDAIFLSFLNLRIYKKMVIRVHATTETEYTMYFPSFNHRLRKILIKRNVLKKIKYIASTNSYHIEFIKRCYFNNNIYDITQKIFFVLPNTLRLDFKFDLLKYSVSEKLKLLILGRMDKAGYLQKGFIDFLLALKILPEDVTNKFDITIIGKGEYRIKLLRLAKGLNVNFIEELSHERTLSLLLQSDVVVLPSRFEGLSMFALEALATGNVCLFSNTGGLVDLVKGNGFLFPPQNIEALAELLNKLSKLEKNKIIEMKKKSVEIYRKRFHPKVVAEKFYNLLNIVQEMNDNF